MRNALRVLMVSGAVVFAKTTPASAQCGEPYWSICGDVGHMLLGTQQTFQSPHGDCRVCVSQWSTCHAGCNESSIPDSLVRRVYVEVVAAARRGDVVSVLKLAPMSGGYAWFNKERNAAQVLSCLGDAVIASLPLSLASLAVKDTPRDRAPNGGGRDLATAGP
jgi:hypothetical protein